MEFSIEYNDLIESRLLTYLPEECSFNMTPIVEKIDFEVMLNKISLSVIEGRVIQLWGFCGIDKSMKSDYQVPLFKKGLLKVDTPFNFGFVYPINNVDVPIFLNENTGWVCIGNPVKKGKAVEFINNCVAVIDNDKKLASLWLKPQSTPSF